MTLDLSLPHRAPELGQYGHYNWDDVSFALYTLVGDKVPLQEVVSALEKQWFEQGNETHVVRAAAPGAEFDTLQEIVQAHIDLDKGIRERSDGGAMGDLGCWPTAFIVIVREDWKVEDANMLLSGLNFGDEDLVACKVIYG